MKKLLFGSMLVVLGVLSGCQQDKATYAEIETDLGTIKVMLYDETPIHRDNFIKLANEGFYDGTLFHRVMKEFMIQGGDPDSKGAAPGVMLGQGGPGYLLDAELGLPHFRGALAAARTQNPEKKSSGSQFYIVQGRQVDDAFLNSIEQRNNITYSEVQRKRYKEVGGTPFLDNDYTVFGEVVEGMEVVDAITEMATDPNNRPTEDVAMKVRIVK
jgi:cyclophilin family peptidyl-prolyl cis-trans isomerase